MKITNAEQMQQALEQINRMYRVIAALKERIEPQNARNFEIMVEGPVDEILKLQAQIDDYLGIARLTQHVDRQESSFTETVT